MPIIFTGLPTYLSTSSPIVRASPTKRRRTVAHREHNKQEEFINADKITSYQQLTNYIPDIIVKQYTNHVLLYTLVNASNMLCQPSVYFALRISEDLSVTLWLNDTKLEQSELTWLFGHTKGKLQLWSQLNNLIARYAIDIVEPENTSKCQTIADSLLALGESVGNVPSCNFLSEQILLLCCRPHARRYSVDMIISAFSFFIAAGHAMLNFRILTLPSIRLLKDISSNLSSTGNSSLSYLKNKADCLDHKELLVNIQLDEVHITSKLVYHSGKVIGSADNTDQPKPANRLQCFMLSSIMSPNRDVVCLVPVQRMTSEYLTQLIKDVIRIVTGAGYTIVSILSDNNVVNRKSFISLGGSDNLVPYMINPVNNVDKIYFLFDSVHLLKSVRNNWINLKNTHKTFTFPDIEDNTVILHASFDHLKVVYNIEVNSTLNKPLN